MHGDRRDVAATAASIQKSNLHHYFVWCWAFVSHNLFFFGRFALNTFAPFKFGFWNTSIKHGQLKDQNDQFYRTQYIFIIVEKWVQKRPIELSLCQFSTLVHGKNEASKYHNEDRRAQKVLSKSLTTCFGQ